MSTRGVLVVAVGLVVLGGAAAGIGPASAGAAPTIGGPSVVGYYDRVTLTGTTPAPDQAVTVYFRSAASSTYASSRQFTSDSSARFSLSYFERQSLYYYAQVGTVRSTVHRTALVVATCTVSAPAFTRVALAGFQPRGWHSPQLTDFASMSASANGVWAGAAVTFNQSSDATVAVIRWTGGSRATVLNTFTYRGGFPVLGENSEASVSVAGVTHSGAVVAAVAGTSRAVANQMFQGFVWANGQRYRLHAPSGWSVHPTGVYGLSGAIVGWVRNGPTSSATHSYAVSWATPTSPLTKIAEISAGYGSSVSADAAGDIAYVDVNQHSQVHISGADYPLTGPHGENGEGRLFSGPGTHFYGSQYGPIVRWNVQYPSASGIRPERTIAPRDDTLWIAAAGGRGDVVVGWGAGKQHLRTSYGAYRALPAEPSLTGGVAPETAINENGTVAFTSTKDSLVHLLRCTR
jgi:hypothetical protein